MVVEALTEKGEEKSTARSASDSLLEPCQGLKKSKSVGMITLGCGKPEYVPSFLEPAVAISLMSFGHVGDVPEYKPVDQPKPRERGEQSRVFESESGKKLEEICNVEIVMSKRKMTNLKLKKL